MPSDAAQKAIEIILLGDCHESFLTDFVPDFEIVPVSCEVRLLQIRIALTVEITTAC